MFAPLKSIVSKPAWPSTMSLSSPGLFLRLRVIRFNEEEDIWNQPANVQAMLPVLSAEPSCRT